MTNIQMKNNEKAVKWLLNMSMAEYEEILNLWDKVAYDEDEEAEKALKAICKANRICYKYVEKWLWE